jgi:hypothetical protein
MWEHGCRASHNEGHDGQNIRPKQLRNREVPWEGSHGSKLMSRRTERPYQVDGAGEQAPHGAAPCSVPEINGPVVQREFTFLLRETCNGAPSETAGARVSNGLRAFAGVSRGRSTESNEPGNTGGPHHSGRAELGRQNTTIGGLVPGAMKPIGRALGSDHRGRERVAALSVRTARNRRTRTRMYGGVGGGRGNPPADPIRNAHVSSVISSRPMENAKVGCARSAIW